MMWPIPGRHEHRRPVDNIAVATAIVAFFLLLADCIWGQDAINLLHHLGF